MYVLKIFHHNILTFQLSICRTSSSTEVRQIFLSMTWTALMMYEMDFCFMLVFVSELGLGTQLF